MKHLFIDVPIPIEEGSELHGRLVNLAAKMGVSLETAVRNVVTLGITHHIEGNLPTYERAYDK